MVQVVQALTLGYFTSYFTLSEPTSQDTQNAYLLATGTYIQCNIGIFTILWCFRNGAYISHYDSDS